MAWFRLSDHRQFETTSKLTRLTNGYWLACSNFPVELFASSTWTIVLDGQE